MENYMTIDDAIDLYGESVFGELSENNDICEASENFPTKDRRHAARRKKAYFKGKNRFNTLHSRGLEPLPKWEPMIRGFLRKTNVLMHDYSTPYTTTMSNIRRLASANDKLSGYFMEG